MLPHEFLPIHQSFARGPCDGWAGCYAAGDTGGGKTAARDRDDGYAGYVSRHALLSGQTARQRLPGLSACCAVHADGCSSRTLFRQWHSGPAFHSYIVLCFRRFYSRWSHWGSSGPSSSNPDLIGVAVTGSATLARADIKDYEFQVVDKIVKKGDAIISVRLVHMPDGKPVPNAVIFATRLDMAPDGME